MTQLDEGAGVGKDGSLISHAIRRIVRAGKGKDRSMTRRLALALIGLVVAAGAARGQVPLSKDMVPSQRSLARLGLERHWFNVVPLTGGGEKVLELSIGDGLVFVQTNQANFHVFDAESGRRLWSANLGRHSVDAQPASANASTVFVTNSNIIFALDRRDGRVKWSHPMLHLPASATSCDDDHVFVGLRAGMLITYDAKTGRELWSYQTRDDIKSRPEPAGRVVAFASTDGKVYISRADINRPLMRWTASGPISAPLNALGVRTLLVPSEDKSLYAIDLWTGETKWAFPTGAPILQEPLVAGDDIYVVNSAGMLSAVNAETGASEWTISTLGGPLLGVTPTRLYLESIDGDLFFVDRTNGAMLYDPRATHERAGLNLRDFQFGPTNRTNDRMYIASKSGMLVCIREAGAVQPFMLRDPKAKPFGYVPPEGYEDAPKIPAAPQPAAAGEPGAAAPGDAAMPK
jgi:outer membrane protein assembly factor BamB